MNDEKYTIGDNIFKDIFVTLLWLFLILLSVDSLIGYIEDVVFSSQVHTLESLMDHSEKIGSWSVWIISLLFASSILGLYFSQKGGARFEYMLEFIYRRGFLIIFLAYIIFYFAVVQPDIENGKTNRQVARASITEYKESMTLYNNCVHADGASKFIFFSQSFDESINVKPSIDLDTFEVDKGISLVLSKPSHKRNGKCISKKEWEKKLTSYKEEIFACLKNGDDDSLYIPGRVFHNGWLDNLDKRVAQSDIDTIRERPNESRLIHTSDSINSGYERAYNKSSFKNIESSSDITINNHFDFQSGYSPRNNGEYGNCTNLDAWLNASKRSSPKGSSQSSYECSGEDPDPRNCLDEYIDKTMEKSSEIYNQLMEPVQDQ